MHDHRPLAIPLISATLVGLTVLWAFPENLGFWRSVAIVSGWAGCGLLAASLLLMIREARLAAWLGGLESMYLWHHRLGVSAYLVLLVHPLALAAAVLATGCGARSPSTSRRKSATRNGSSTTSPRPTATPPRCVPASRSWRPS